MAWGTFRVPEDPIDENLLEVGRCAAEAESIPTGLRGSQMIGFADHSAQLAPNLRDGDVQAWKNFLKACDEEIRKDFQKLAPKGE